MLIEQQIVISQTITADKNTKELLPLLFQIDYELPALLLPNGVIYPKTIFETGNPFITIFADLSISYRHKDVSVLINYLQKYNDPETMLLILNVPGVNKFSWHKGQPACSPLTALKDSSPPTFLYAKLLTSGADINLVVDQKTILDLCKKPELKEFFQRYGAKHYSELTDAEKNTPTKKLVDQYYKPTVAVTASGETGLLAPSTTPSSNTDKPISAEKRKPDSELPTGQITVKKEKPEQEEETIDEMANIQRPQQSQFFKPAGTTPPAPPLAAFPATQQGLPSSALISKACSKKPAFTVMRRTG